MACGELKRAVLKEGPSAVPTVLSPAGPAYVLTFNELSIFRIVLFPESATKSSPLLPIAIP